MGSSNSREYSRLGGTSSHPLLVDISGKVGVGLIPEYDIDVMNHIRAGKSIWGSDQIVDDGLQTIDLNDCNMVTGLITQDTTYSAEGGHDGQIVAFILTQDNVGNHSITFDNNFNSKGPRTAPADSTVTTIFGYDGNEWVELASSAGGSLPSILEGQTYRGNAYNEPEANSYLLIHEDGAQVTVSNSVGTDARVPNLIYVSGALPDPYLYPNRTVAFANIPTSGWLISANQSGSETDIYDLILFNGEVYGSTGPNGQLLHWTGVGWEVVAPQYGSQTDVYDLTIFDDDIYAASGPDGYILKWNGTDEWILVNDGNELDAPITSILGWSVAGVYNLNVADADGNLYSSIYDSVYKLSDPYDDVTNIRTMVAYNDDLYAGGDGSWLISLISWFHGWDAVAPLPPTLSSIYTICEHRGLLYVAGNDGNLYTYDGIDSILSVAPMYEEEDTIRDMKSINGKLYAVTSSVSIGGGKLLMWNEVDAWIEILGTTDDHNIIHSLLQVDDTILAGGGGSGLLLNASGNVTSNRNIYIDVDGKWHPGIVIDPAKELPNGNLYNTLYYNGHEWVANGYLQISPSGIQVDGAQYINFSHELGEEGYGLRNNNGHMQYRHSDDTWKDIGSGGAALPDGTEGQMIRHNGYSGWEATSIVTVDWGDMISMVNFTSYGNINAYGSMEAYGTITSGGSMVAGGSVSAGGNISTESNIYAEGNIEADYDIVAGYDVIAEGAVYGSLKEVEDDTDLDLTDCNMIRYTLTEDTTFVTSYGGNEGQIVTIILEEDATGGWVADFGSGFETVRKYYGGGPGDKVGLIFAYDGDIWKEVGGPVNGIPWGQDYLWLFKMVDIIDYATPMPGLICALTISKDGGIFDTITGTPQAEEIGYGWYKVLVPGVDMRCNQVVLRAIAPGAGQTDRSLYIV